MSRFGIYLKPVDKNGFWIHCASVGEVVAAQQLIERLLQKYPAVAVTVTTNTMTGRKRVAELFTKRVNHCYLPYDFPLFVNALLAKLQPRMLLITEMELWPNLCHGCWKKGIPFFVINARMSEKSTLTYQKLSWLMQPLLNKLSGVCAQGERDYQNYRQLGLHDSRLCLSNNIKFDLHISDSELELADTFFQNLNLEGRILLVAGSTHEPEEQVMLDAYLKLAKSFPNLLLVIVPRHPQRFEFVNALLTKQKLNFIRISQTEACNSNTQVILADQMGILRSLYALASVAFVGGSIALRGGHNALEPAALGVPILMGKSIYNNPQICEDLAQVGALSFIDNSQKIVECGETLLSDPALHQAAAKAGLTVIAQNRGALERTLSFLQL
ncbi:3-deoxy-D-manno-octulosonic acid transferase [Paraglaciecola hydrolytica]|uniref:3-deoxy-D-manno-octulosonic acid transferase n=1 Tax=Paraglaciecola hydrolytica TaxID=1799789 RepID=UPI001F3A3E39|nr:3-deoxy-D-manno-octulosonic acid transferase [Paraglaciecola hydrolytica]